MAKKIAVTGGIGSGKSTVISILKNMGYSVFSCDEIYGEILLEEEYIEKVAKLFPAVVENGQINRKALSEYVFNHETNLVKLNALAHPIIMERLLSKMEQSNAEYVFAEVPLLFEGNFEKLFDKVIYIHRDKNQRLSAIIARDDLSIEQAKRRIDVQFDSSSTDGKKRLESCNALIIENNTSKEEFLKKLSHYISKL
jgi:dephospho-CoA kinase